MHSSIADTADALREGIARGYLSVRDAIGWAELQVISGQDDTTPLVAELALAGHRLTSHILLILSQLAWGADPQRAGRIAAGHLHERLRDHRLEPRAAAHAMYQLMRDGYAPDAEFESHARRYDEEIERAEQAVADEMQTFLARYAAESGIDEAEPEPPTDEREQLTLSVERVVDGRVEMHVGVSWQWWSGRVRAVATVESLEGFATQLRDFAAHESRGVRLTVGEGSGSERLGLNIQEYGRARRAALEVQLVERARADQSYRAPSELRVVLPTEHELLGVFAADIAELLAAGFGTARLRILRSWPDDT